MQTITLIRHGQASYMSDDYDRLSELGVRQSAEMGRYWAAHNKTMAAVYVGPLRRQQQTWAAFAEAFAAGGGTLPEPMPIALEEHSGPEVMTENIETFAKNDPYIAERYKNGLTERRQRLEIFRHIMRLWARAEIVDDNHESYAAFCARVVGQLAAIKQALPAEGNVAVFTSGGVLGAVIGHVLGLGAAATMEASWLIRNTGNVELIALPDRLGLNEFNAIPHLTDSEMETRI